MNISLKDVDYEKRKNMKRVSQTRLLATRWFQIKLRSSTNEYIKY